MKKLDRRELAKGLVFGAAASSLPRALAEPPQGATPSFSPWTQAAPGVWKAVFGRPEALTPVRMRQYPPQMAGLKRLPALDRPPLAQLTGGISRRGVTVSIPLAPGELVYGFGLQMYSLEQRGTKKKLRPNADPRADTGEAHAPVPFFVTSRGTGILIDTARDATFYCGDQRLKTQINEADHAPAGSPAEVPSPGDASTVLIEVPRAEGIDVYAFEGPHMLQAVQRYNLFSGGGCLPPEWGLGFWYRTEAAARDEDVFRIAKEFRDRHIPCDVLGLEPGWQSHAYSCTYLWDKNRFPDPAVFVNRMGGMDFEVNLWEHAFTNPRAPFFQDLKPYAGDYSVWNGLVPDFAGEPARRIYGEYHRKSFLDIGISGFKLDECDGSDYTGGWSFPDLARFPSGVDGEQMHSVFGLRFQDAILEQFKAAGKETYGLVRSSGALAAPYPFVLYSDLYDHRCFIRALVNSGFSGLLWCPEVRDARDEEDLIRRLQSVVFSPLAMINGWYIKNPPWKQQDKDKNNAGEFNPGWEKLESICRRILEWRMELIPYLWAAFQEYQSNGIPPFRALVLDDPGDARLTGVDDQYLVGDRMMVAPFFAGETSRSVVLPRGEWCDYWTAERVGGERTLNVDAVLEKIPVYVKSGSIFPAGGIGLSTKDLSTREVTVRIYGDGSLPWALQDGRNGRWELSWDAAAKQGQETGNSRYRIVRWQPMG